MLSSKMLKYYLRDEVAIHNKLEDLWLIINKIVYDLTPMIKDRLADTMNDRVWMICAFGGKDISLYFDEHNYPMPTITTFKNEIPFYYKPAYEVAWSEFSKTPCHTWWEDPLYMIGRISEFERSIRMINTITGTTKLMKVCEEDTIDEILEKYRERYNSHAGSYCCRSFYKGVTFPLDFNKTLTQNALHRMRDPNSLWLYFSDDFTVA